MSKRYPLMFIAGVPSKREGEQGKRSNQDAPKIAETTLLQLGRRYDDKVWFHGTPDTRCTTSRSSTLNKTVSVGFPIITIVGPHINVRMQ